jgi:acetylornithine/succinyldiaminopimelate/putrescine aminotransferase
MLEPIQAEGGVNVPSHDYLPKVREICDRHGILLILDEVQTGMGRTGKLFAHEHYHVVPDILTVAKGLGGGVPIGATLSSERVASAFEPGTHASTFGGNPLVCAAAKATLDAILEDGFALDHCTRMGAYFLDRLQELKKSHSDRVTDVRGKGLLLGMECTDDVSAAVKACMERGLLVGSAGKGNVLRFSPPLIVDTREIDHAITILDDVLDRLP